jgi:hypothetical protein
MAEGALMQVRLIDIGWDLEREVLGCARRSDGRHYVLIKHWPPENPAHVGTTAFITSHIEDGVYQWVWAFPRKLEDFILGNPVGTEGKASNRRVTVTDPADLFTDDNRLVVDRRGDNWVSY